MLFSIIRFHYILLFIKTEILFCAQVVLTEFLFKSVFLSLQLHDSAVETNRVWIGLNSFGSDGNFKWADWTAVDFTYFAPNEPDNFQNQEKCVNMNKRDGMRLSHLILFSIGRLNVLNSCHKTVKNHFQNSFSKL